MEKGNRKCIVKHYFYNIYYDGCANYSSDFLRAKIYNESKIPDNLKNNHQNEIIFLDTEKGLELLLGEFERLKKLLGGKEISLINHNKT